ncbi:oligosaccharide flippase family protein [Patescibacteria group bacterium]
MINKIKNNAFARNSMILFAGTMLGSVLNYLFHLIIGRMVSVEIYGEVQSLTSLINIISVPAMTITMIATKYSAMYKATGDKVGGRKVIEYLNKKVTKFGLPVFVLAVIATPFVGKFLNIDEKLPIIILWVFMFFSFYASILNGSLAGWQKFKQVGWLGMLSAGVKLVFGIVLVKLSFGVSGVMGSFLVGAIAAYIASLVVLKFIIKAKNGKDGRIETIDFKSIKSYVMPALVGNLSINILGNIDMVMAKHNLDSVLAGQYGALTIVSKIIFFATGVIATVLFAMSAEDSQKKSNSIRIFVNASYLMIAVAVISIGAYFVMPDFILGMLFGDKYTDVSHYLGWFAILVTLFSFVNLIFQYLLSIQKTKVVYSFLVIAVICTGGILFFGKSFYAILIIASISQVSAIVVGLYFLFKKEHDSSLKTNSNQIS